MTRILVTGITGFVGGYLASALADKPGVRLYGIARNPTTLLPTLRGRVTLLCGDLESEADTAEIIGQVAPDVVYHLAGQASVAAAWESPWPTYRANIRPQLNLLHNLTVLGLKPRFLSVTSSKVYSSLSVEQMPITEATPLMPDSAYGISKMTQDIMAHQYYLSHGLPVIRARPFNHIGPRQKANFVTASFAQQIARAEAGQSEPIIRVGNLDAKRDFTDVRDVVSAYLKLMEAGVPGEAYNIGSGTAISVQYILDILLSMSHIQITVERDPGRMRPADQPISYGDTTKIRKATGWQPQIKLADSLAQILDYWRAQVSGASYAL